ncbi:unnamed protein product [Soboliphyme baturini]|uniref:Uncharacterized protein n=1 Tax=Soboliphyme baturini TaxID=241478 RepID=A0A183ITP6_9BILA|nr:unnamed protein product [Soboliphyme baturini]
MKRNGGQLKSKERVRTHLIYFAGRSTRAQKKIRRRRGVSIVKNVVQHDAAVQTPYELDPSEWTGNQRVVHFGPMAYRDPMLYYYPKGWNVMYPAHFGFFPYRTRKFRGSSPIVCLSAFGTFFAIGGCAMVYLAYNAISLNGFFTVEPLKVFTYAPLCKATNFCACAPFFFNLCYLVAC